MQSDMTHIVIAHKYEVEQDEAAHPTDTEATFIKEVQFMTLSVIYNGRSQFTSALVLGNVFKNGLYVSPQLETLEVREPPQQPDAVNDRPIP